MRDAETLTERPRVKETGLAERKRGEVTTKPRKGRASAKVLLTFCTFGYIKAGLTLQSQTVWRAERRRWRRRRREE